MRCDGLVVSTPQGSTGYNLANGGPVLAWGVRGFVVSFIAPHSLTARSLVVAPDDLMTINNRSRDEPVEVHVDGRPVLELKPGRGRPRRVRARDRAARAAAGRELLPPPARAVRPAGRSGAGGAVAWAIVRPRRNRTSRSCRSWVNARRSPRLRSVGGGWYTVGRAARAARREPPADRAGRAAARARPERAHGGDGRGQDRARPRARPAARRQAARGDRAPGGGRGVRRGHVRAAGRGARRAGPSCCPRTPRRSCSRGA